MIIKIIKVSMATKIIKVAIKAIRAAMFFVLELLLEIVRFIADLIAGQSIPYWEFIKTAVNIFPWLFLPPAIAAMYVLAILEVIHGEYSRAAVTAIAGTCFLGWIIILRRVRREQRQAKLQAEIAERSFHDKFVVPLPSEARELYGEIIAASDIKPETKNAAKELVTIPSQVECGKITREVANYHIGACSLDPDYRMQRLVDVLSRITDQMLLATPSARAETHAAQPRTRTHAAQPRTRQYRNGLKVVMGQNQNRSQVATGQSQNSAQVVWTEQELAYNRVHCPAWVASHSPVLDGPKLSCEAPERLAWHAAPLPGSVWAIWFQATITIQGSTSHAALRYITQSTSQNWTFSGH